MKILIMNSGERGKGASSLLKSIIYVAAEAFPKARLSLMSVSPETDEKKTGIQAFPCLISRAPTLRKKIKMVFSMSRCLAWTIGIGTFKINLSFLLSRKERELLRVYQNNDLILTCVADCLTDDFVLSIPIGYLYLLGIGIFLKKPVAILASQIGPYKNSTIGHILSSLTKHTLNRVKILTVRDKQSLLNLREIGVSGPHIHLTADLAFLLKAAPSERAKEIFSREGIDLNSQRPLIGINASFMAWKFAFPEMRNPRKKYARYVQWMRKITDYLTLELQATVVFIPHVFGPGAENDRATASAIYKQLETQDHVFMIKNEYFAEEMKAIFGQLDLLISTRMHPMIHAMAMNVPTIGIYYSFKVSELMRRLGQAQYALAISQLDKKVFPLIKKAWQRREQIKRELAQKIPIILRHSRRNIEIFRAFDWRETELNSFQNEIAIHNLLLVSTMKLTEFLE